MAGLREALKASMVPEFLLELFIHLLVTDCMVLVIDCMRTALRIG
jgi:hypothetical protein